MTDPTGDGSVDAAEATDTGSMSAPDTSGDSDTIGTTDGTGTAGESAETQVGRFTEWFRVRPTALQFWEVLATDERLVFCFAGQCFSAALLRADMGTRTREMLDEFPPEEALALSERNFAVSLADLEAITLRKGTRTRKARLTIEWTSDEGPESWVLSNTNRGTEGIGVVEELSSHEAFADVAIESESPRLAFL